MATRNIRRTLPFIGGAIGSLLSDTDYLPQVLQGKDLEPSTMHSFTIWLILFGIFLALTIGYITALVLRQKRSL